MTLRPAKVHAQEHLGPIRRFGAAGSGAYREQGVALVVLPAEKELPPSLLVVALQLEGLPGDLFLEILVRLFLGEVEQVRG
jgi:hypothetical protein